MPFPSLLPDRDPQPTGNRQEQTEGRRPTLTRTIARAGRGSALNRESGTRLNRQTRLYNWPATLDDPDQNDDDSQDEQNMNEASQSEGSYESQEPQDQKDHCKGDK